ncbi:hypothetical protein V1281_002353 [Nitrobacteraceae bacterium AZCC 2161]
MNFRRQALALMAGACLSSCSYPRINEERVVEVRHFVEIVECEMRAVEGFLPAEANPRTQDVWDIGSTLDLTLVNRVDADGKVSWAIPVVYSLAPSVGGHVQDTITAHVAFSTDLAAVLKKAPPDWCTPSSSDPSGTGLGLAAWIATTFNAVEKDKHGGLTYTRIFELQANGGARFGYVFAPINLDVGASATGTKTNQLVVAISPHSGPQKVIIVGDTTRVAVGRGSRITSATSASKTFSNPNLINLLNRQTPLVLTPGQTQQIR